MDRYPNVSVKLILRAHDRICTLLHADGSYDFPGGQMEWGESPEQTLQRELKEELAYTLSAQPKFLDIWNYISKDMSRHSLFVYYYAAIDVRPNLTTVGEEAEAGTVVRWLTKEEAKDLIQSEDFLAKVFSNATL